MNLSPSFSLPFWTVLWHGLFSMALNQFYGLEIDKHQHRHHVWDRNESFAVKLRGFIFFRHFFDVPWQKLNFILSFLPCLSVTECVKKFPIRYTLKHTFPMVCDSKFSLQIKRRQNHKKDSDIKLHEYSPENSPRDRVDCIIKEILFIEGHVYDNIFHLLPLHTPVHVLPDYPHLCSKLIRKP